MKNKGLLTTDEKLRLIHETALRVLAEIGIRTDHTDMRDLLAVMGCRVESERVFIPPELVAATLEAIPPSFRRCR